MPKNPAKIPSDRQLKEAWAFIETMREEWTAQDWADFYHGVAFAFFKIKQRHERASRPEVDYQI